MNTRNLAVIFAHAIGAPIFFSIVSRVYFSKINNTAPLQMALIFVGFVITVDFFVVALLINKSLGMFASPLGTWISFALIFASNYVTGLLTVKRLERKPAESDRWQLHRKATGTCRRKANERQ